MGVNPDSVSVSVKDDMIMYVLCCSMINKHRVAGKKSKIKMVFKKLNFKKNTLRILSQYPYIERIKLKGSCLR